MESKKMIGNVREQYWFNLDDEKLSLSFYVVLITPGLSRPFDVMKSWELQRLIDLKAAQQ